MADAELFCVGTARQIHRTEPQTVGTELQTHGTRLHLCYAQLQTHGTELLRAYAQLQILCAALFCACAAEFGAGLYDL